MNDQKRIKYFTSEIARLSNQVVDLLNERDELEAERDALAATVNTLKNAIMSNCYDDPSTSGKRLMELADKTPQQCLAEIRADAIHDAIEYAIPNYGEVLISELVEYADKLRQGGE